MMTGAMAGLQQELQAQEERQQREFMNTLQLHDRDHRDAQMRQQAMLQREQMAALAEQREAQAELRRQQRATGIASTLAPGAQLDDQGAAALRDGGMGALIDQQAPSFSVDSTAGLGPAVDGNPLGLSAGGAKMVPGRSLFKGTAKQQQDQADRKRRADYIKSMPTGPARAALEAQDATGDTSLSPALFTPPKPELRSVRGVGLVQIGPDGTQKTVTPERDRVTKPGAPQVFYGEDGKPHAIQFTPGGGATEVPLPAGLTSKTAPKPAAKTPQQIEQDAAARSRGTATGKKEAGGGSRLGDLFNRAFGGGNTPPAPAPTSTSAPAVPGVVEEWVRDPKTGKLVRK